MLAQKKKIKEFFSLHPIKKRIIPALILLGISVNLIMVGSLTLVSEIPALNETMQEYSNQSMQLIGNNIILDILILAILVPFLEELIYRVLPLNKMIPRISPIVAVILTSIAFGLSHGQIVWIIYTIPFGALLAAVFLKYKSALANIIVHCMFNLTSVLLMFLPIEVESKMQGTIIILSTGIIMFLVTGLIFKIINKKEQTVAE